MFLIKVGGSLIAPKNLNTIDYKYLQKVSSILNGLDKAFIVHGTGNIGHRWVLDLKLKGNNLISLIKQNYDEGRKILDNFFSEVDKFFPDFMRLKAVDFINKQFFLNKTIIGGDILPNGKIISSDEIFSNLLSSSSVQNAIMLTDVDGVLGTNGEVIRFISQENFDKIKFWEKDNDVTGAMKAKIKHILDTGKNVIICNGYNFQNLQKILAGDKSFIGTIVGYLK